MLKWNSRHMIHYQFCRRNRPRFALKWFFYNFRCIWLVFEDPHGELLFCFGLALIDSLFVTCDKLINVFWSTTIVLFQHFFTPIESKLLLSDCPIVRNSTRINLFGGQEFMQYWMYTSGINAQGCHAMSHDHLTLTVHARHQCSLAQRLFLEYLKGPRLLATVVH